MEPHPERSWKAEHQHQLQLLVESIQDYAIFLLDTQGRVMTWTKSAERISGYSLMIFADGISQFSILRKTSSVENRTTG